MQRQRQTETETERQRQTERETNRQRETRRNTQADQQMARQAGRKTETEILAYSLYLAIQQIVLAT